MAELLEQFRHFCGNLDTVPGLAPHMARLKISARLLPALTEPTGFRGRGFARLGGVLREWVDCFEDSPECFSPHLYSPLERLADLLEEILARRDRGAGAAELAEDAGWRAAVASFRHAGTPLAVLEDVDDQFRRWQGRWNADTLTPVQEQQLHHRWLRLRRMGDHLFRAGNESGRPGTSRSGGGDRPRIVLLVDSTFRRDRITAKLVEHDYRVEVPADTGQALDFLNSGLVPRAVLCDNLEPTRHLAGVRDGLAAGPLAARVPLVLIGGGSGPGSADLHRAKSLGAAGAWREPYDPVDLHRILQRLSQP